MKLLNTLFVTVLLLVAREGFAQSFNPSDLSNLALWLRADTGVTITSGKVSGWNDISGNGIHNTQATASLRPSDSVVAELCNHHAVYFSGGNVSLNGTAAIPGFGTNSITVFVLVAGRTLNSVDIAFMGTGVSSTGFFMMSSTPGNRFVIRSNGLTTASANGSAPGANYPFRVLTYKKDLNISSQTYVNGQVSGTPGSAAAAAPFTNGGIYTLGKANYGATFQGYIAEVIVYTRNLSSIEQQQVEQYIFDRYSSTVNLGADINEPYSLCPQTLNAGNCFSSYLWSTGQTTSQIQVSTSGTYSVTTTDVFGISSVDTIQVTLPDAKLLQPDTTICIGQSATLSNSLSAQSNYTYLWQNGSTQPVFSTSTNADCYVTVTDTFGCSLASDTATVSVDSFGPTVSLGPDGSLCAGNTIQTTSPSSGLGSYSFLWSTGDTSYVIPVTVSGNYSVAVTNANNCTGYDTVNVTVLGTAPTSAFTGANLCLGQPYLPANSSTGNSSPITAYNWNFGNGDASTLASPSYTYTAIGSYTVSLGVTNQDGCSSSSTQTVVVKPNPTALFNTGTACINNPFQFTDLSIPPAGDSISQWSWAFGDGGVSNIQNPSHNYTSAGTLSVSLNVTASNGCSNLVSQSISVVSSALTPTVPLLQTPADSTSLSLTTVSFVWNPSANTSSYKLEISTDNFTTTAQLFSNLTATTHNVTLAGNQTYQWKVTAYNLCQDFAVSKVGVFSIFLPSDLPNLALWLRADTGVTITSGKVSGWNDISGNGIHASQVSAPIRPLDSIVPQLCNNHAIFFSGNNTKLDGTAPIPNFNSSSATVFVLVSGDSLSSIDIAFLGIGVSSTGFFMMSSTPGNRFVVRNNGFVTNSANGSAPGANYPFRILTYKKDLGVSSQTFVNGQVSGNPGSATASGPVSGGIYTLGKANYGATFRGYMAEVIVYNRNLSSTEQQQVEQYIFDRYSSTVNLGTDIHEQYSLCPKTLDAGSCFGSYLWSTGQTTSQIQVSTSGIYSVTATDVFGRVSKDTIQVTLPYIGMSSGDTAVCLGQPLSIAPVMTNSSAFQYLWNDNSASTSQTLSPSVTGNYFCVISDGTCNFTSDTVTALLDSLELRSLLPTDTAVCSGNHLLADGGIYQPGNVVWNTAHTTPSIIITAPGIYSVDYTDVYGCNTKDTATVTIKGQAPATDFSVSVTCQGEPVVFADVSLAVAPDNIVQWAWDFGDGQTANGDTVQNQFSGLQQYTVTHTVLTDSGCSGVETKVITISPRPVAELSYGGVVCAGTSAQFYDNSQVLITDNISQWKWTFNGADVFTIPNPVYEFPTQGEVPVCLSVTTNNGCVDSMCTNVEVFAPLVANFNAQNFCLGDSILFKDLTPSLSVVGWQWNFDDGSFFGTTQNVAHKYTAPGSYTVRLRVENAIGCSDTTSRTVQVITPPVASFTNQNTCEDQFYSPVDNSVSLNEPITNWRWSIGTASYNGQAVQHFFADTGNYAVKLKVTTASGCVDSAQQTVKIYQSPVADFDFTPLYGEAPVDITFNNTSSGATSYNWSFGDGNTSSANEPNYTYTANDTFTIQLQATSDFGCNDVVSKELIVIKTDLDLSVDKVKTIQTPQADGSTLVTVVAALSNIATRTITHFQIYATLGDGTLISEEWNGTFFSGQKMDYVFAAHFVVTAGNANTFVCAEAKTVNNGQAELRTDNNANCASLTETLQLSGPSPNPAFSNSALGIILPKAGEVHVAIADITGRYAMKEYKLYLAEGRNNYVLPIHELQAAEYFIRVRYNDETQVRKIVVR